MLYLKGHLARPLDAVLTNATRLAVLRQLAKAKGPMSGRRLAKFGGVNHQAAADALETLRELGLVKSAPSGRAVAWALDKRRWLVSELLLPFLEKEAEHADAVAAAIKKAFSGLESSVALSGKAAASRLEPGDELEIVVVAADARKAPAAEAAASELRAVLTERWGLRPRIRVLSRKTASRERNWDLLWQLLPSEGPITFGALGAGA